MVKNVYVLSLTGWNDFLPVLWPSAKTYYELNGQFPEKYNPCLLFLPQNRLVQSNLDKRLAVDYSDSNFDVYGHDPRPHNQIQVESIKTWEW